MGRITGSGRLGVYQEVIKVAFLIRSLDCGGTERQVVALAKAIDKGSFEITIVSFYSGGSLEKELETSGVRLISLNKGGRWDLPGFLSRFARCLRLLRPDVIHGYLDIPNLLALSAKFLSPSTQIIWGARASDINLRHYDWLRRLSFRLERIFSRFADCIIVNSNAGRRYLLSKGFPARKLRVVFNGIDTELFQPGREARAKVRMELGVSEDMLLVGLVGRLDPIKDHYTFLRAASLLRKERRNLRFVCVGSGPESYARKLYQLADQLSLNEEVIWIGTRSDMTALYNALDINVSTSESESFSNVIGEAMACAVPCVVTDVGDSALIVGDTGIVVPPQDPEALRAGLISCLQGDRSEMGKRARLRIQENWSVQRLAEQTESVILAVSKK
jgi:glycosyltransferase involved in cell wall biosynthesis